MLVSCVAPLGWLVWQVLTNPAVLRLLHPDAVRWDILGRTCGYSALAAGVSLLLAWPAGLVVGRRRSRLSGIVAFLLPVTLLLPSLMYAYGWAQCFRLLSEPLGRLLTSIQIDRDWLTSAGISVVGQGDVARMYLVNTGPADVARCIWSLAAWLWPIPAAAIAWSLRRADPAIAQQAQLDGATSRVALRQAMPAALVGLIAVWVLASQEFAVYEPTGVSVVATEVRMVFETGSFSSGDNPMTAPLGGGGAMGAELFGGTGGGTGEAPQIPSPNAPMLPLADIPDVQQRAAAAAVATAVPMLLLTLLGGAVVVIACRRWSAESDEIHTPSTARPGGRWLGVASLVVVALTVGVPIAGMVLRHQRAFQPVLIWRQSGELVLGSLLIAALAGLAAVALSVAGMRRPSRVMLFLAVATFLVGGQLLAIALIRLYNRPHLGWVYNAPPILVMAYLGRFGWLALLAAGATWSRPWRLLRQQAQLDGAAAADIVWRVVLPLAWPLVAAAGLLVLVLSLTEVPATVLAAPFRPPQIVPMLMTWVHTLESDPMIESSLLLAAAAMTLSAVGVVLVKLGSRVAPAKPSETGGSLG